MAKKGKSLTYAQYRQQSQEEKDAEALYYQAEENLSNLKSDILATKRALSKAKHQVEKLMAAEETDLQAILDAKSQVEELEDGLKEGQQIIDRLYPNDTVDRADYGLNEE